MAQGCPGTVRRGPLGFCARPGTACSRESRLAANIQKAQSIPTSPYLILAMTLLGTVSELTLQMGVLRFREAKILDQIHISRKQVNGAGR